MEFIFMLLGAVFSALYCLLAGWDTVAFGVGIPASPLALYAWYISGYYANIIKPVRGIRTQLLWRNSLIGFWILSFWLSLPIMLRLMSILFEKIGYQEMSITLYTHRYLSIIYFYIFVCSVSVYYQDIQDLYNKIRDRWLRIKNR
jgi:hypothetical protein